MRIPIMAGNWKMNKTVTESVDFADRLQQLLTNVQGVEVVIAPTLLAVKSVADRLEESPIAVAAQNVFWKSEGAYTGEVSAAMLKDAGCRYVIVGHSERRQYFGERDDTVAQKIRAVLAEGLYPILCIGESLEEREKGSTWVVVERQLTTALQDINDAEAAAVVVAYEPVWAIGTGRTATPEQAQEVHAFVRARLSERFSEGRAEAMRIQYGGSVKPDNIGQLMAQADIDGALVGGASLDAEAFAEIVRAG